MPCDISEIGGKDIELVSYSGRGIKKGSIVTRITDLEDIPDTKCDFDPSLNHREMAQKAVTTFATYVVNTKPCNKVTHHTILNKHGGISLTGPSFMIGIAGYLIWQSVYGLKIRPSKKLYNLATVDGDKRDVIRKMALLFENEFDGIVNARDILDKNLISWRTGVFDKVKLFGVWSNAYVLANESRIGIEDEQMCKGLQFEFALAAFTVFDLKFYQRIHKERVFLLKNEEDQFSKTPAFVESEYS